MTERCEIAASTRVQTDFVRWRAPRPVPWASALGNVRIGGNTISIWDWKGHEYLDVTATQKLEQAVARFDRARQMQPGSFRINLNPSPVQGG